MTNGQKASGDSWQNFRICGGICRQGHKGIFMQKPNPTVRSVIAVGIFLLIAVIVLCLPAPIIAADWKLVPKIGVYGGYDDNILFKEQEKLSSTVVNVEPGLEVEYESLLSSIHLSADLEVLRYLEEEDFDRENQYYRLTANHRFGQRWDSRAGFNYYNDNILRTYLEDTGRVEEISQIDREYFYAMGGMAYNISTISSIDTQYRFEKSIYDSSRYTDYNRHRVDLRYKSHLKNQQDAISIGPSFYHRTNNVNDTDYISLDLGWERDWSPITNSLATIGGRYAMVENQQSDDDLDKWGVRASLRIRHKGPASSLEFMYYHDVDTTAAGTDINVDNFKLRYNYRLTERFSMGLYSRFVLSYDLLGTSSDEENYVEDSRYLEIRPFLGYRLTEKLDVSINYAYQNSSEDIVDSENTRERNRFWIEFAYEIPLIL